MAANVLPSINTLRRFESPGMGTRSVLPSTRTLKNLKQSFNLTRRLVKRNTVPKSQAKIEIEVVPNYGNYPDLSTLSEVEPMFPETIVIEESYGEYMAGQRVELAEQRAQFYLNYFAKAFDQDIEPADLKSCFGILYHREIGPPIALDPSTTLQDSIWPAMVDIMSETHSPIYILHLTGAKQIKPEEVKIYKDIFNDKLSTNV